MYSTKNNVVTHSLYIIAYILFAIPCVMLMLWMASVFMLGFGFIAPYWILSDFGFGFWRVIIFGTVINIALFSLACLIMHLDDDTGIIVDWDNLLKVALLEVLVIGAISYGYHEGFTW